MKSNDLNYYQNMLDEVFLSVGQAIGIHVLLLVLERSLWKIKDKYEDAGRITFSEDGIFLAGLKELDEQTAGEIANEFILSIIATLGRLVGMQLVDKLPNSYNLMTRRVYYESDIDRNSGFR